jgi:hypothetical protein
MSHPGQAHGLILPYVWHGTQFFLPCRENTFSILPQLSGSVQMLDAYDHSGNLPSMVPSDGTKHLSLFTSEPMGLDIAAHLQETTKYARS